MKIMKRLSNEEMKRVSNEEARSSLSTPYKSTNEFQVNDWIIVIYEDDWYPGKITKISKGYLVANFLEYSPKRKYFQMPETLDRQSVVPAQVLMKLQAPSEKKGKNKKKMFSWSDSNLRVINSMVKKCIIHDDS